ncbi:MAG: hypothetical protein H5T69_17985, partial [Chloroflexi bacterium]|nr:hypothetical protein [Chloroflexota bacterium]
MASSGMPFVLRPLEEEHEHGEHCSLRALLPPALRQACEHSEPLDDYLHRLPLDQIG